MYFYTASILVCLKETGSQPKILSPGFAHQDLRTQYPHVVLSTLFYTLE